MGLILQTGFGSDDRACVQSNAAAVGKNNELKH
jgi:hypothetical protein